jgi:hypothetical protein
MLTLVSIEVVLGEERFVDLIRLSDLRILLLKSAKP